MSWIETVAYPRADGPLRELYDRIKGRHRLDRCSLRVAIVPGSRAASDPRPTPRQDARRR